MNLSKKWRKEKYVIKGEVFDSPHRQLKVYHGEYFDLSWYFPKISMIPDIYKVHWETTGEDEKVLLIPDEIYNALTKEQLEFIEHQAVYMLNKTKGDRLVTPKDIIDADVYALHMTGAKISMLRDIEEAYKRGIEEVWGPIIRWWYMRGRKKELLEREAFCEKKMQGGEA